MSVSLLQRADVVPMPVGGVRAPAENPLTESPAGLSEALELLPHAAVALDLHGRIHLLNSHAEDFFNCSRNELIGKSVELLGTGSPGRKGHNPHSRFSEAPTPRTARHTGSPCCGKNKGNSFSMDIDLHEIDPFRVPGGRNPLLLCIFRCARSCFPPVKDQASGK